MKYILLITAIIAWIIAAISRNELVYLAGAIMLSSAFICHYIERNK